jgi:hypothetical protein
LDINGSTELGSDKEQALDLGLKVALTDPKILTGWNNEELQENGISSAWAGSYKVFGGAWKSTGVQFDGSTKPMSALHKPKYQSTPILTATNDGKESEEDTPKLRVPRNPYYIEKKPPAPPTSKRQRKEEDVEGGYIYESSP